VLRTAIDTRKAYFQAVAAEQSARYFEQVREAAEAGAELARGMRQAGKLVEARTDARAGVLRRRDRPASEGAADGAGGAREADPLMGLAGRDSTFSLPEQLPALPAGLTVLADVEPYAVAERLDLRAMRLHVEALNASLELDA